MGVVYRARDTKLNRTVALKMIVSGHLATGAEVERFKVEAEAAARLEHPNIVPIYEVGFEGGRHFFTMKYVEGEVSAGHCRKAMTSRRVTQKVATLSTILNEMPRL
jgi:serine/threonine-protein kinase